ncbi:hypothetical protein [Petropleomorpha daqingensis]|uniref:Uncharacterized protein n=1 Tax=Petropleomorpha daqingensis TaxID=2026353 RepID=A0A853CFI3_9ACTN|nr:hypothetical protein [Petropleomorpha daqingensis]NYJ06590.1 hypothetical protein [Petropleomorpha daqingensis]
MRLRRPPASAVPRPTAPAYVEDWVASDEPVPAMPEDGPRQHREPVPDEPAEAVPWRVLAEERVEAALREWEAAQPPIEPVDGPRVVRTRDELPASAAQGPEQPSPADVGCVSLAFQGATQCVWRDVRAFLAEVRRG